MAGGNGPTALDTAAKLPYMYQQTMQMCGGPGVAMHHQYASSVGLCLAFMYIHTHTPYARILRTFEAFLVYYTRIGSNKGKTPEHNQHLKPITPE